MRSKLPAISEISPEAVQPAKITISSEKDGLSPIELDYFSLLPKEVTKFWHKLGSLLHSKGLSKDFKSIEFQPIENSRQTLEEILPLLRKHLTSQVRKFAMNLNTIDIECSCGFSFPRETNNTTEDCPRLTACPNCGLQYHLVPGAAFPVTAKFECPHESCRKQISLNKAHFDKEGKQTCPSCQREFGIKWNVAAVADVSILDQGLAFFTITIPEGSE